MNFDNIDEYRGAMVKAYAKNEYQKGYEQGKKDAIKHGHWIHVNELPSGGYFKCSECNRQIFLNFEWKVSFENPADEYRYCPGCGSRMDFMEE